MKTLITTLIIFLIPLFSQAQWIFYGELGHGGNIVNFACPDSNNCYVLDQDSDTTFVYESNNQGKNFHVIYANYPFSEEKPYLFDANRMVSPIKDYIYSTYYQRGMIKIVKDGGKTIERIHLTDSTLYEVKMLDSNIGIAFSTYGIYSYIFVTKDGWKTFKKIDTAIMTEFSNPVFVDSQNIQMVLKWKIGEIIINLNIENEKISTIYDFNLDTNEIYHDTFQTLHYANDSIGFLAGSHRNGKGDQSADIIYRTKDKGKSWAKIYDQENYPIFGLQDIAFYNKNNGVAVGDGNKILMTNDGGDTWVYERPETMNRGYDTIYGSLVSRVAWFGKTPVIGTYGGNVYRYEGDFFKFDKAQPPVLISPENNTIAAGISLNFSWNFASTSGKYIFQLARDKSFHQIIDEQMLIFTDTEHLYGPLNNYTTYYWRVGIIGSQDTTWSETFKFRTKIADCEILSPVCGDSNQNTNVTLYWKSVSGANFYRLRYGTDFDLGFGSELHDSLPVSNYKLQDLDSGKTYYWQAQAFNKDEENEWSPVCFFKTVDPKSDVIETIPGGLVSISQSPEMISITVESENLVEYRLEIFDFSGNSVLNDQLNESQNIDLAHYASGVYFYKISRGGEIIRTGKFTVVR